MPNTNNRISQLIIKQISEESTAADEEELRLWMEQSDNNRFLAKEFLEQESLLEGLKDILSKEQIWKNIKERTGVQKVVPLLKRKMIRLAAAAIFVGMLAGTYWLMQDKKENNTIVEKKIDIDPGAHKASLRLADGRIIILDSAGTGELAKQGTTIIVNKNGQLVYTSGEKQQEVLYNTLSTARGEAYSTVLADGTKVWLNSASSIKFPVTFNTNERKVEITGEAYFEVAKNTTRPFKINIAGRGEVEVLGTHFNITAYENETAIKTTLLEGSVRVNNSVILKPGQQAIAAGTITVTSDVDTEKIIAWKENIFLFSADDIQTVMRQIERWYEVEVEFKGEISDRHFTGIISRNNKVSEVLKMLQGTGKIQFEITGKKIVVSK